MNLKGEAYFEVTKNRKHSFIVQTESVNVEVLGTHFNVESYPDDPEVKTTLLEGSVAVSNKSNSVRIVLKPNESAIYNKEKKSMTLEVSDRVAEEITGSRHGSPVKKVSTRFSICYILLAISTIHTIIKK